MSIRTTISNYTGSTRYKRPTYSRGLQAKPKERERTERERREECQGEKNLLWGVEEGGVSTKSSHIVKYPCILTPVGFFIAHAFFSLFFNPPLDRDCVRDTGGVNSPMPALASRRFSHLQAPRRTVGARE